MSLVTRVSVAVLVALALALGGFSASLYYLAGLRLRLALDQELEATLDHFPEGAGGQVGRVTWAIYDEAGRRVESTPGSGRPMILDGLDLGPLAVDVATTIKQPDGLRWRVLARKIGGGRPQRGPHEAGGGDRRHGPPARDEHKGAAPARDRPFRVLAAWASLEPVEAEIRWLGAILPLISLGLWALSAAIGRHFARRALAPLALMAESARAMPFDDGRLPSPGTRDELEEFASSFNGLLERLHVALERQKQFTGQASHQLRTPLAALIAAIEVARRRRRTVEEHEEAASWTGCTTTPPGSGGSSRRCCSSPGPTPRPNCPTWNVSTCPPGRSTISAPGPTTRGRPTCTSRAVMRTRPGPGRTRHCSASCWTTCSKTRASTANRARPSSSAPGANPTPWRWRSRTADAGSRPRTSRASSSRSFGPIPPVDSAIPGWDWDWPSPGESPWPTAARSPRRASRAGAVASWSDCLVRRRLLRRSSNAPRRSPRPRPEGSCGSPQRDRMAGHSDSSQFIEPTCGMGR